MNIQVALFVSFIGMIFVFGQMDLAKAECDLAASTCPCPKIYKPICASNDETYNNECIFECFKKDCPEEAKDVKQVHEGRCEGDSEEFEDSQDPA